MKHFGTILSPGDTAPKQIAIGAFSGLHIGHQKVIEAAVAAKKPGELACVLTFDFGRERPPGKADSARLLSNSVFEEILAEMGVDALYRVPFGQVREQAPGEFVELLDAQNAKGFFCGENFRFGKAAAGSAGDLIELGARAGISVTVLPLVSLGGAPVSSTRIRQLVGKGDMPGAAALLGRPYTFDFIVERGRRLGRELGLPTINQPFPPDFQAPRFGVYASLTTLPGGLHTSVTNVGVKPTVGSEGVLAETHIHDFSGDLYDRAIRVELLEFIRPERAFESLDALRQQMERDSTQARKIGKAHLYNPPKN